MSRRRPIPEQYLLCGKCHCRPCSLRCPVQRVPHALKPLAQTEMDRVRERQEREMRERMFPWEAPVGPKAAMGAGVKNGRVNRGRLGMRKPKE